MALQERQDSPIWITGLRSNSNFVSLPIVLARMLLNEFQSVLLCKKHEPVHGPFGLFRIFFLLLGRWNGWWHHGFSNWGGQGCRNWRGQPLVKISGQRRLRIIEFESTQSVAQIRCLDSFGMIGRNTHIADRDLLTRNAIFFRRHPGLDRAPTWKRQGWKIKPLGFVNGTHRTRQFACRLELDSNAKGESLVFIIHKDWRNALVSKSDKQSVFHLKERWTGEERKAK